MQEDVIAGEFDIAFRLNRSLRSFVIVMIAKKPRAAPFL